MRVAQVAPLYESVPPKLYGGTERVVSYLTEELVSQGHEVTLFASGDSVTSARLIAPCREALRLNEDCIDPLAHHVLMLEQVFQVASEFDIIHFHCDYLHYSLSRNRQVPNITTLHGRLDLPDLVALYKEFTEVPVVSISNAQREPLPWLNWQATVYHGLPPDLYRFHPEEGKYLAFLGRICADKGIEDAIECAKQTGIELRISAKVDHADEEYFEQVIKPLLDHPLIKFVGETADAEKNEFLGNALALLAPIRWPEPFGIVMIEAMACGTPVIAFGQGSVPEVIDEGKSGVIVQNVEEAVAGILRGPLVSRETCRATFDQRFTAPRMARDYLQIYKRLTEASEKTNLEAKTEAATIAEENGPWTKTSSA